MKENAPNETPIELLLIDDDEKDIFLTQRAFRKCGVKSHVQVAKDGEEGVALLRGTSPFEMASRPDLIMLDLNMPRMTGYEFLDIVKTDEDLKSIPVIVMTMSQSEVDMERSYWAHANAFLSKPLELDEFTSVIHAVEAFWFKSARLPQRRGA